MTEQNDTIVAELEQLSRERSIRILYACESGSRAWGFASPDSDYDVRFIYCHPTEWHLQLNTHKDTIECFLPGDLDLSGWELGKALRLFAGGNSTLYEWLGSPVVYQQDGIFIDQLRAIIPGHFNPRKALYHYLGIARKPAQRLVKNEPLTIKAFFYLLRSLLAGRWIEERKTMPPTAFQGVLPELPAAWQDEVAALLERKRVAKEQDGVQLSIFLTRWILVEWERLDKAATLLPKTLVTTDWSALNALMQEGCLATDRQLLPTAGTMKTQRDSLSPISWDERKTQIKDLEDIRKQSKAIPIVPSLK